MNKLLVVSLFLLVRPGAPSSVLAPSSDVSLLTSDLRWIRWTPVDDQPGYDVSGDDAGHGCPHKVGTCLVNEEFSLGKCDLENSLYDWIHVELC